MADFELEDKSGNRYRIRKGAGPKFWHPENLGAGSSLLADNLLSAMPANGLQQAHNHFYFGTLHDIPNLPSGPQAALSTALSNSYLTIEKIGTALAINDDEPDPRNELRVKIRNALMAIVAGERAEAAMYQKQMDKETTVMKGVIYTGAFMQGVGSSAWGMVVWLKEVSDVVNPFVKMQHHARALQAAWESDDFSKTYSETYVKGEKRELVEALGFDPSQITEQQIDEAMAMANLVIEDPGLRDMLYQFVKDYAEAQHAIEITNVAGTAAFELILTIIMAAVTGGVGAVAAIGSKAHLIKKFQKVGDLLSDFAKATRKLKLEGKKRKAKGNSAKFSDMETDQVQAKKTDAHGAETGPKNSANATVPKSVPMTQEKYDEIINLERGNRPNDVGEYLSKDYVDSHLNKFKEEGGAFIVIEEWISAPEYTSFPKDGKFVGLSSEMDQVVTKYKDSGGDWRVLRDELNLGENTDLSSAKISYVKLSPNDPSFEYSMPNGNERGAYEHEWVPGGLTKSGTSEATLSGGDRIIHNNNVDNLKKNSGLVVEPLQ
ncbi:hypothetical protein [Thalassolituus oleivorans]|uniref:Bacterial toxin 46 domain-containing protein n=2 Tax=root TaxID=1 RepID=M5DTF0_9GAMM|nr:hypothetical protein [Thalassolituus oleivorans]CCU73181.1 hypothetical protein TOL_2785 [Thalassolituus oleivorans MIL-1]